MKRLGSSDSPGALMSFCPATDEQSPRSNHVYTRDFHSMLDGLDEDPCAGEETGRVSEKKRRLSANQVKALEKNFEVENKLEPERKIKLAQELGLQPRQVAVWFQNRRARWKTKQLERDYGVLKAKYDALERNYESLQHDNEALLKEIKELKSKVNQENRERNASVKEEAAMISESEEGTANRHVEAAANTTLKTLLAGSNPDLNRNSLKAQTSSDSDSSAILNEGNSPNNNNNNNAANSSPEFLNYTTTNDNHLHQLFFSSSPTSSSFRFSSSSPSSIDCISFTGSRDPLGSAPQEQLGVAAAYHPQFDKLIEHDFLSGEEACGLFSDEQAPSLHWYCPDHEI